MPSQCDAKTISTATGMYLGPADTVFAIQAKAFSPLVKEYVPEVITVLRPAEAFRTLPSTFWGFASQLLRKPVLILASRATVHLSNRCPPSLQEQ